MDATEPAEPTSQAQPTSQTQPTSEDQPTSRKDLPDLDAVSDAIKQAHEAEESLLAVDPNAINPAEAEHPEEATDEPTEPDVSVTEEPDGPRAPSDEPG